MRKFQEKLHDPEFYLGTMAIIVAAIVLLLSLLLAGCTAPAAQIEGDGQAPQVTVVAGGDGGIPVPEFEVLSIKGEGEFKFSVFDQVMYVDVEGVANLTEAGGACAVIEFRWTLIQLTTDYPKGCSVAAITPQPKPAQASPSTSPPPVPSPSPDPDTTP